jgi:fructose-bisphosphate aldolase class II
MSVISFKNELRKASQQQYAIPLFNVFDQYAVDGLYETIVLLRAPAIIGVYAGAAAQPNIKAFTNYIRARFEDTDVPVTIMLDHGASVDQCLQMIDYGFTDVMYDGSTLPVEENIANTQRLVTAAHAAGVAVEAELGHVGSGADYDTFGGKGLGFTDPAIVENFVHETGVDFLAIAFGNAHGLYKGEPKLNLGLVSEIHSKINVPLSMHGGTGLSDDQFKAAINAGVAKINYATNVLNSATANMKKTACLEDSNLFSISDGIRTAYRDSSKHLFTVFCTEGKA